jgi:hypothetical protein
LIDAKTLVLSPLLTINVNNLKPNIVKSESEPEIVAEMIYENPSTTTALVIMNPYEAKALMRFTASASYNGLSSEADALIDTEASLNFVSKDFVVTNDFHKDCKTVPKLSIRVDSERRISTTKLFCPTVLLLTYNLESYHTLKGQILCWGC